MLDSTSKRTSFLLKLVSEARMKIVSLTAMTAPINSNLGSVTCFRGATHVFYHDKGCEICTQQPHKPSS